MSTTGGADMQHLYTEINRYGIERQNLLLGKQQRERILLSDGRLSGARQWLHTAGEWLVDQLAILGQNQLCVDNEPFCDVPFAA
jgi:hypothetical protein